MDEIIRFRIADFAFQVLDIGDKVVVRKVQVIGIVLHSSTKCYYVLGNAQSHEYDGHDLYHDLGAAELAAVAIMQAKEAAKNE